MTGNDLADLMESMDFAALTNETLRALSSAGERADKELEKRRLDRERCRTEVNIKD